MVLVEGCSGILLLAAWCCMPGGGALGPGLLLVPPTPCPPLATSAHVGEGVGEGGGWVPTAAAGHLILAWGGGEGAWWESFS